MTPHVVPHGVLGQRLCQQRIERLQLRRRQFGQGQSQVIGNRPFRVQGAWKCQFMKRIGINEGLSDGLCSRYDRGQHRIIAQRRARQRQLCGQALDTFGTLLRPRFLETPVPMQRNRAADGGIGTVASVAMLNIELIIVQVKPQRHRYLLNNSGRG